MGHLGQRLYGMASDYSPYDNLVQRRLKQQRGAGAGLALSSWDATSSNVVVQWPLQLAQQQYDQHQLQQQQMQMLAHQQQVQQQAQQYQSERQHSQYPRTSLPGSGPQPSYLTFGGAPAAVNYGRYDSTEPSTSSIYGAAMDYGRVSNGRRHFEAASQENHPSYNPNTNKMGPNGSIIGGAVDAGGMPMRRSVPNAGVLNSILMSNTAGITTSPEPNLRQNQYLSDNPYAAQRYGSQIQARNGALGGRSEANQQGKAMVLAGKWPTYSPLPDNGHPDTLPPAGIRSSMADHQLFGEWHAPQGAFVPGRGRGSLAAGVSQNSKMVVMRGGLTTTEDALDHFRQSSEGQRLVSMYDAQYNPRNAAGVQQVGQKRPAGVVRSSEASEEAYAY